MMLRTFLIACLALVGSAILLHAEEKPRKIVLIAGALDGGHPRGTHEYEKTVRLLAHCLTTSPNLKGVTVETHFEGWPKDEKTLDSADTIVLVSNGSDRKEQDHPFLVGDRMMVLARQMKRGCGLVTIHWSTFFPNGKHGDLMLDWVGGHFDYQSGPPPRNWASAIQHVTVDAKPATADHAINRGVKGFKVKEEFYYQMKFIDKDPRLSPILVAPIADAKPKEQVVAWAVERKDGGRGFGFTGGHYFENWYIPEYRKMVLNAIVWTAKVEVPKTGVDSTAPSSASLDKPIETLILTGHDGPFHDWKQTSKMLKEVLEQDSRFKVRIIEDPEFLAKGDLLAYDLIVQNYVNWERGGLSDKAKEGLLRYLKAGRGFAVIHFANGAFHSSLPKAKEGDWPEYRKIVRRVWDHNGGSAHDNYGAFKVNITALKHPITEGMKDFDTVDELYFKQAGEEKIEPLVTAKSKVTGKDEPLAWAYEYEKSRVFQTLLGHSADSIKKAGELIRRGSTWAANREQLTASVGSKDVPEATVTLAEGKFGKALNARKTPVFIQGSERFRSPPLTVECWVKLFSKKGFNVFVASDPKSSPRHWELYSYAGNGHLSVYVPGSTPAEIQSNVDVCDGQWHYVAAQIQADKVTLFVDGKLVKEQAIRSLGKKSDGKRDDGPLMIGMAQDASHKVGCDGLIDEVRISRAVRKIDGVPKGELALDEAAVGVWRFDRTDLPDVDPAWTPRPAVGNAASWEKETDADWIDDRFRSMDTGPFLDATIDYTSANGKVRVYKGLAIKVGDKGEGTVLFDRGQLRLAAAWTGGFLHHSNTRFGLLNIPTPVGTMHWCTPKGPGVAAPNLDWTPKTAATAPLPPEWARFRGLYLHGNKTILSYTVGDVEVLDFPWLEMKDGMALFTRTIEVGPSSKPIQVQLMVEDPPIMRGDIGQSRDQRVLEHRNGIVVVRLLPTKADALLANDVSLHIPPSKETRVYKVLMTWGKRDFPEGKKFEAAVKEAKVEKPSAWIKGGPGRYTKPIETRGELAADNAPLVVDTLTIPYDNPYKALLFCGGHDFLPDGRIAVCTAHGDVWLVKADAKLEKIQWQRFATGLYQPLGLKVVDGKIVVLERGQLTRLHDYNNDGEADFYENVNNDWHTGDGTHSFDTCLETDPQGNFYFFKTGDTDTPTGGCLLRVSKDGKKSEIFCTGFRHPIGLGISPEGIVTGADQEGNWMPVTRVDQYKLGGFYGDMRAHHRKEAPKIYNEPLVWLPKEIDNSAGGQVWVPKDQWGPLGGQLLHLSYGRCKAYLLMRQTIGDVNQAGAADLGLFFLSGSARGRFNPVDHHLYVTGLRGWQTAAQRDGCLQRVRYTDRPLSMPVAMSVEKDGIKVTFSQKLDRKSAEDVSRYLVEQWNYRWSADYGSKRWSVAKPDTVGQDTVVVQTAKLLDDGRTVYLKLAEVKAVMQMRIEYKLTTEDGKPLVGVIHNTIHKTAP